MGGRPESDPSSVCAIESALRAVITWSVRNDVQQETMRRTKCDLPPGSIWLLHRINEAGPVRLTELATMLGVDASTMTPQTKRLEREGLIARRPDPSDGRAVLLSVTRPGRALLERAQSVRRSMLGELLTGWSERDLASAARLLTRLADSLA
jgi:DNA-binding MarR family transcriptional regulator